MKGIVAYGLRIKNLALRMCISFLLDFWYTVATNKMAITDIDELTADQKKDLDKYLSMVCTSRCGNDIDCPHEQMFLDTLNEKDEYDDRQI